MVQIDVNISQLVALRRTNQLSKEQLLSALKSFSATEKDQYIVTVAENVGVDSYDDASMEGFGSDL